MVGWIPVGLILFACLPPRRALLVTVIENMGTVSHDPKLDDLVLLEAL